MSGDLVKFPVSGPLWTKAAKEAGIGQASIYHTPCESASKMSLPQYLLLRSFWIPNDRVKLRDPKKWGIKRINEAEKWLEDNKDWLIYLQNLSPIITYSAPPPGLGTFAYAWFIHHQVISLPTKYDEGEEDKNVSFSPISGRLRSSDKTRPRGNGSPHSPLSGKGYQTPRDQLDGSDTYYQHDEPNRADGSEGEGAFALQKLTEALGNVVTNEGTSPSQSLHSKPSSPSKSSESEKSEKPGSEHKYSPRSARRAFPKVEDEQIVNGFLIALLASICMYHNGVKLQWSLVRKAFKFGVQDAEQDTVEKPYLFEARTDGHLASWNPGSNDARASAIIVEVKPTSRGYNNRVVHQATAQMAAWIFQEPDAPGTKQPYQ